MEAPDAGRGPDVTALAHRARQVPLAVPFIGYVFAFVLGGVAVNVAWQLGAVEDGFGALIAGMLGLWLGMLVAVAFAARITSREVVEATVRLSFRRRDLFIGLPVGVVAQLVVLPLLYLPLRALFDLDVDEAARDTTDLAVGWRVPILVVALVFAAPLVEEIFFRGLLQGTLVERLEKRTGVVVAAVVFAAIHFQIVQFPGLLVAGLTFGVLAARYDRLGPAVWAHVGFNAATVFVLLVLDGAA